HPRVELERRKPGDEADGQHDHDDAKAGTHETTLRGHSSVVRSPWSIASFAALDHGLRTTDYGLIRQPIPHDTKHRLDRVLQADLLALFISPARVADRDLVDA